MDPQIRIKGVIAASVLAVGSAVTWVHTGFPSAPTEPLRSICVALVILAVAIGLGRAVRQDDLFEAAGVGLIVLSSIPILLEHLGLFSETTLGVSLGIGAIIAARGILQEPRTSKPRFETPPFSRFDLILTGSGVIALAWGAISCLAPPAGMDALTYHLGLPAQYLAREGIAIPNETIYYQYNQLGEMLALLSLPFDGSGRAVALLFHATYVFASLVASDIARSLAPESAFSRRAGSWAFTMTAVIPLAGILAAHTKPDLPAIFFYLLGLRAIFSGPTRPLSAALFLGSSVACKVTAAYGVVPALLYLFWMQRRNPKTLAAAALLVCIPAAYWHLRNMIFFGHLLPQAGYLAEASAGFVGADLSTRLARFFGAVLLFFPSQIDGPIGPLVGVSLIIGAFFRGSARALWTVSVTAVLLWFLSGGGSHAYAPTGVLRFVLPAMIGAVPAGALVLAKLHDEVSSRERAFIRLALAFAVFASVGAMIVIMERYQRSLPYLSGGIPRSELMEPWILSWKAQEEGNRTLPPDAFVLSVGEPRLFHLKRKADFDVDGDLPSIYRVIHDSGHDTAALHRWLAAKGYTHVFDAPKIYAIKMMIGLSPWYPCEEDRDFLESYLRTHGTPVVADPVHDNYILRIHR